jgi:HEAT repeat protein
MAWQILRLREPLTPNPVYQGKPLSEWLNERDPKAAAEAIRQMGTNALPRLLKEAAAHDSIVKALTAYLLQQQSLVKWHFETDSDHQAKALRGFRALGTTGAVAVAQGLTNSDKWIRHGCVGQLELGKQYQGILFEPMLNSLKDPEPMVRARAANALGMLGQQPDKVIPVLIDLLGDKDDWVRCMAAVGLDLYGDPSKPAVPALLRTLTNCSAEFRSFGTHAVMKIDPVAAAKAGVK